MLAVVCCFLVLGQSLASISSRPFSHVEEHVQILSVDIEDTRNGGRRIGVNFEATQTPKFLWYVGGKAVLLNDDGIDLEVSESGTATLTVGPSQSDGTVTCKASLKVLSETILIRLAEVAPGSYSITNHTSLVLPRESLTYGPRDKNRLYTDVLVVAEDADDVNVASMLILPDYCTAPHTLKFGFPSSQPPMIDMESPRSDEDMSNWNDVFMSNWNDSLSGVTYMAKRARIVSVNRQHGERGLLRLTSTIRTGTLPVSTITRVNTILFKPRRPRGGPILRHSVMFIGWQNDIYADQFTDVDFHIYAMGNPAPAIVVERTPADRLDIEEAYFKHTILRFRNVTHEDAGRYVCTAVSGRTRRKQTFTLFVRKPCDVD